MSLHFSKDELKTRREATTRALHERHLDGMLLFRQESMYYLSGYDSFGYCFFQCMYLGGDGRLFLLTRAPDLRQARHTSVIEDIRIWRDEDGSNPALQLRDILNEYGVRGKNLGVELDACGLSAFHYQRVHEALTGFCTLEDASHLVSTLRAVKSESELVYVRRAANLADDALDAAMAKTHAGAFEGDILAAMHNVVFSSGGDYPSNEFIIGAGEDALLCRYFSGRKHLAAKDQLTLEFAGVWRRYHACLMRTILIGQPHARHLFMHEACVQAMQAAVEALRPGHAIGDVFAAHACVMDDAGLAAHRLNACGYSLGATYAPTWMDWPMLYADNPLIACAGMVFFLHMILADSEAGLAMTLGQTVLVTETGVEELSRHPLDLVVCD